MTKIRRHAHYMQMPPVQVPIEHGVPSTTGLDWQPTSGTHASVVHSWESSQVGGAPGVQTPTTQVSSPLHGSGSAHGVASSGVKAQPTNGTQASAVHTWPSSQVGGAPGVQTPTTQVSSPLHGSGSAHEVPSSSVKAHPTNGTQASAVHTWPSSQTIGVPAVHTPAAHVSSPLH
jgi:hypothetical protein